MAKINGNDFVITAAQTSGGTQETFLHASSGSLEWSDSVIEVTTKDSSSSAEFISGRQSGTISVDGLLDYSSSTSNTLNAVDIWDLMRASANTFYWAMSGDDRTGTGKVTYSGEAICTSFNQSGGSDEAAAYSATFQITGAITKTVA